MIGCGTVGTATARLLLEDATFQHPVVADRALERARPLADSLDGPVTAIQLDCLQEEQLVAALDGISIVLNTAGSFSHDTMSLTRTVIETGISYADVNDDVETLQSVFDSEFLDSLARHRDVGLLPGLGVSPDSTNSMARHLASRMETVEEVRFYMVNDATYRSEGVWHHRLSLFGEPMMLYDQGAWTQSPVMSQYQDVAFPAPWGNIRCYMVGLETGTIPLSFDGLRHASFWREFSDPATTETLKGLVDTGFASEEPLQVDGVSVATAALTAAVLVGDQPGCCPKDPSRLPRQVVVKGTRAGRSTELAMTYSFRLETLPWQPLQVWLLAQDYWSVGSYPGLACYTARGFGPGPVHVGYGIQRCPLQTGILWQR